MKLYIGKRLLLFIPTLLVISILAFAISVNAPGDPVERLIVVAHESGEQSSGQSNLMLQKKFWRAKLGLDLPLFYFELSDLASPDTLYRIADESKRKAAKRLLFESGNWNLVAAYFRALENFEQTCAIEKTDSIVLLKHSTEELGAAKNELRNACAVLPGIYSKKNIEFHFRVIESNLSFLNASPHLLSSFYEVKAGYLSLTTFNSSWKNYIPMVHFHAHNQYHRWIFGDGNWLSGQGSKFSKGIIRGDFGTSYSSKDAVSNKIIPRIKVSLFFSLLSIILAYVISIPIAAKAALSPNSKFDTFSSFTLFSLYSLPSFFLATLLLMTFANPDMLHWFPASGLQPAEGIPDDASFLLKCKIRIPYLILPLICFTYSSLAFLSRSMRSSLLETLSLDYIRTARAKGISERNVVYKHAFKNALLPIITLFANVLPYAIGGSVILETIFTLPGMGLETYIAIQNQDYPVIVAVFTITGFMTLLGALIADILYAAVDPRISFSKTA